MDKQTIETIVRSLLNVTFSRAGGPGGQNVNKVNTKITAKLHLAGLDFLSEDEKQRVRENLKKRINRRDEIVLQVQERRLQGQNREIAVRRVTDLLLKALKKKKKRIFTRPSTESSEKRLLIKKLTGQKKKSRKHFEHEDFDL